VTAGCGRIGAYLSLAIFSELYTMIWDELMDVTVLVAFGLSVSNQYDHL